MAQKDLSGLDEEVLRSFIWSVHNFFTVCTHLEPEIKTPYLFDNGVHKDYTGTIGVSGNHKGAIYLSFDKSLIVELLKAHFEQHQDVFEDDNMEQYRADYTGEIANFIAGNVRKHLGKDFLISVPVVVTSPGSPIHLPQKGCGIVFPISWQNHECNLILNFQAARNEVKKLIESF